MRHLQLDESTNMAEDDSWLEAEIQRELDAINSAELEVPDDSEEPDIEDNDDVSSEDEILPPSIMDYLTKVKVQSDKLQHELEECDTVLEETSIVCQRQHLEFDEDLQQIAQEEGIDVQTLKARVIIELDKEDIEDEKPTTIDRNRDDISSERVHGPEFPGFTVCKHGTSNTDTQQTIGSKKIESVDLTEMDTRSGKEQAVETKDEQNSDINNSQNTDSATAESIESHMCLETDSGIVENSNPGNTTELVNNPNTEFTNETNSGIGTCADVGNGDEHNHGDAGGEHGDIGSNHGDIGSNHDDIGSNHDEKTLIDDRSEVNEHTENADSETNDPAPLLPDERALVPVTDSTVLERQLLLEVSEWDQKRRTNDKLRQQELLARQLQEDSRVKETDEKRNQKRQEILEEEQRMIEQRERLEADVREEVEEMEKQKAEIQESFEQQQSQMDELIAETRAERDVLEQTVRERSTRQEQKKESAATKIQATFRKFRARLLYGAAVEEKREAVRMTIEAERVRIVEQRIQAINQEENERKQREEEEKKEQQRKKQEEAKAKQELEKKKKEEKERKKREEKEKRRQEEEEKRIAEEEKKLLEKQRKQEEKQKKVEEAKKKKEEEKQRKEAVAQRKKEEAAQKQDEKRREEEMVRAQEEQERTQREMLKTDEQMTKVEDTVEHGREQLERESESQPQYVEPEPKDDEETKRQEEQLNMEEEEDKQDEEKEDKQDEEQLETEDMEKKNFDEEQTEKKQDVKEEGDVDNERKKDRDKDEGMQKEKGNGERDEDDRQSSQAIQEFEDSHKRAQEVQQSAKSAEDLEQSITVEQTYDIKESQSGDSVKDMKESAETAKNLEKKALQKNTSDEVTDGSRTTTPLCSSSNYLSATNDWGDYLPEPIDNKRLTWIKDCLSWSKISGSVKMRPGRGISKKPPRRPASAKTLEPLAEVRLLSATGMSSLQKITTVQLQDLPGCCLSTLGQCIHLKALSLNHCGLITVEGLEPCTALTYLDLQNNRIEMISPLKINTSLVYVNLAHNCLSTIHGLDECANIRYLDLSHNRITRLSGLADLRRLHTLRLQNNQLISCHGIGQLITLQYLDLSHNLLPSLDNLQHLAILQVFNACSNNLLQVPELSNHVLLQQLLLCDNNISSMRNISLGWCPLLQQLDLSKNRVSFLADLSSCLLLDTLDLKDNQITHLASLVTILSNTRTVESLDLTGCPVCQETDYRMTISQVLPTLCTLDGASVTSSEKLVDRTEFEEMCLSQVQQEMSLRISHETALERCSSHTDKSQIHKRYFDRSFQLAVKHRQSHEYGEVTVDPNTTFDLNSATVQLKQAVSQTANMKALFDEAVRNSAQTSPTVNIPRPPSGERPKDLANRPQSHLLMEKTGASTPTVNEEGTEILTKEDKAAVKIQALWRGHNLRHKIDYYTRMSAAMTIQAYWRGFSLRKRLHQAMQYARGGDTDSDSCYGEVNMEDFDFSEADLDKGWTPPDTPQLPLNHAILGPTPGNNPSVPHLFMHSPFPPDQPKQAWRHPDSPFSQTGHHHGVRIPLAPLSVPSESGLTQRTTFSKKEEQLTEEWGFKEGRTAELMLQRAKKLKYNAVKRKKLSKLDPQQRLALLRRLEQPQLVQPPTRRVAPRMEYFKGRVLVEEKKARLEMSEKRERMFEWLHTQVGNFDITSSRINKHLNSGSRERSDIAHNLPLLDPGVIAGGRTQLMGSPNNVEMQSLYDGASSEVPQPPIVQRRLSMQDDYKGQLPKIKTTSAPVIRVKEKLSWRNKGNMRMSGGWGGGRKRSKPV